MVSHTYKFISGSQNQTTPSQERNSQDSETFLAPFGDKQTRNYDKECSNRHAYRSTISPKELSSSKMKWWAIYTNLQMDVIVRLNHRRIGDIQGQEMFSAPSADKKTCNYDIVCSNHHPSLSTVTPKGFSHRKGKWWATHTNILVHVMVRLAHPRSGDSQKQERFLAPSADKKTSNYDKECSNRHPSLSTLCEKGLSRNKIKWWAIYTNLPMDVIVRIRHRRRRESPGQKMFLAPSADK